MRRLICVAATAACAFAVSAAPASAATLEGVCQASGQTHYTQDLTLLPQQIAWWFDAPNGTCTGLVDGQVVVDTPIRIDARGSGPISCGVITASLNAKGALTFLALPLEDPSLDFDMRLVAVAAQNVIHVTGKRSGQGVARASFFGQNDIAATTQDCIDGEGANDLNFTVTVKTLGPMDG